MVNVLNLYSVFTCNLSVPKAIYHVATFIYSHALMVSSVAGDDGHGCSCARNYGFLTVELFVMLLTGREGMICIRIFQYNFFFLGSL